MISVKILDLKSPRVESGRLRGLTEKTRSPPKNLPLGMVPDSTGLGLKIPNQNCLYWEVLCVTYKRQESAHPGEGLAQSG